MKTKVGEKRGSAQPPAHDHNVIHTKRILPEAHHSHQLDRDCSAGRDSPPPRPPGLSDPRAGLLTTMPGAGVLGQHQQQGQGKQKRLQAGQATPTSPHRTKAKL